MAAIILDPLLEARVIEERQRNGWDRHDEVWDGVYMIFAPKDNQHQALMIEIGFVLFDGRDSEDRVFLGVNISDQTNWSHNDRIPDVAVYLKNNGSENCADFMLGGPDLVIEIVSIGDRTFEKIDFYASVKTKGLLILNRQHWEFELYRHDGRSLVLAGKASASDGGVVSTQTIPLNWQLLPGEDRPELRLSNSNRDWKI